MKLGNMFFNYRYVCAECEKFIPSRNVEITSETEGYAYKYAQKVTSSFSEVGQDVKLNLFLSIPESIKEKVGDLYAENDESYAVEIVGESINLYAVSERGLIYAVATLKHLYEQKEIGDLLIFDYPDKEIRGYRVYTPGRNSFDAFKDVVDMMIEYKYNSMILEVGGAMEYKRRPEINEKWVEFCNEVNKSPYEADRIQHRTYPNWQKNSIHADNGGGSFITQDEMRSLIAYCREREITVIPEVPTLSHSDYIVRTYPELNERVEDAYPDTYCPSNPKSYEVVFDILDEVIEVFDPEYVNIGHDECYTLAKCPLCKEKDPVDLYVGDIEKINDYIKARGIKSMMWCEKFFDNIHLMSYDGRVHGYGGTGDEAWGVARCIGCVGKVPKDVTLLNWYWSLTDFNREEEIRDLGYTMIYGNFIGVALDDYRRRIEGVRGGFVSNWGAFEDMYMQRNGQFYGLISTAWAFWSKDYDTEQNSDVVAKVKDELYRRHLVKMGKNRIQITHTTDFEKEYEVFYDGYYYVEDEWKIGEHIVEYTDGTKVSLPIIYGYNIRSENEKEDCISDSTEAVPKGYVEILGATYPEIIDGKMYYTTAYKNPYPEKEVRDIHTVARDEIKIEIRTDIWE